MCVAPPLTKPETSVEKAFLCKTFYLGLLLLLLLRAYAHEHPATSYRRSVDL